MSFLKGGYIYFQRSKLLSYFHTFQETYKAKYFKVVYYSHLLKYFKRSFIHKAPLFPSQDTWHEAVAMKRRSLSPQLLRFLAASLHPYIASLQRFKRASVFNGGSSPCSCLGHPWERQLWLSRTLGTMVSDSASPCREKGLFFSPPENCSFCAICRMKNSRLKIPKSIQL